MFGRLVREIILADALSKHGISIQTTATQKREVIMPLYDFHCPECNRIVELLMTTRDDQAVCPECGSTRLEKLMAAHSSLSGKSGGAIPGPNDTACCGSRPGEKSGCAGPGSCCGRTL